MNRKSLFLTSLNPDQRTAVINFWEKQNPVSIEQHPDWMSEANKEFFILEESGKIIAFAIVSLRKPLQLKINFGPLAVDSDTLVQSIREITGHYQKQVFWSGIQMQYISKYTEEGVDGVITLVKDHGIKYRTEEKLTWSTLILDLKEEVRAIQNSFRKNHLRNISKAEKLGLLYSFDQSEKDIAELASVYVEMYQQRKLKVDELTEVKYFKEAADFVKSKSKGFFITVSYDAKLVGGLLIIYQGDTAFYAKGAIHPGYRELPIMTAAFDKAIAKAKNEGLLFFDFGGYNLYADADSQLGLINHFKKGFGGKEVSYPPYIVVFNGRLARWLYGFFRLYQQWKNR